MTLVIIRGDVGTGKSLFAVGLALDDPRNIRANFHIKTDKFELMEPEDLSDLEDETLAIIDEAWAWLESRLSGKPINLFLSYILFQSRKKKLDMILTTQLDTVIDKRFRQMANFIIDCSADKDGFTYLVSPRGGRAFHVFLPMEAAEKIFPYYDTLEMINCFDEDLSYKVANKQKRLPKQDELITEMLGICPAEKWTQGTVEAYFLEKSLPHAEAKGVYQRIKLRMLQGNASEPPKNASVEVKTTVKKKTKKVTN